MLHLRLPSVAAAGLVAALIPGAGVAAGARATPSEQPPSTLEELQAELERLRAESQERMRRLEEAIAQLRAEREAAATARPPTVAAPSRSARDLNPGISVIGDFVVSHVDQEGIERDLDFRLSEVELGFQGAVDPYLRYDVFAAFHEHADEVHVGLPATVNGHGDEERAEGLTVELEEAFVTTLALPAGLQVRAGRFRLEMGRHNVVHTPEDAWVDQPTVNVAVFGEDQLIDDGVELSWLAPTPVFFKLTGSLTRGPAESPTFVRASGDDLLAAIHSEVFFDLGPHHTLELGQSWARGAADAAGLHHSRVRGVDLTWKWQPTSHRGITFQAEAYWRDRPLAAGGAHDAHEDGDGGDHGEGDDAADGHGDGSVRVEDWGATAHLEVRFAKRWSAGTRLDYFDYDDAALLASSGESGGRVGDRWDASLFATFWPTEFHALRVQAKRTWDDLLSDTVDSVAVNWVWILGAHGAHSY